MKRIKTTFKRLSETNKLKLIGIGILLFVFLFEDVLLLVNKFNTTYPILGQKLNNIPVSNLSRYALSALIHNNFDKNIPLRLLIQGKTFTVTKNEVGAKIDYQSIINNVFSAGRRGNLFEDFITQNNALFGVSNTRLTVMISKPLVLVATISIADSVNQQPYPAMPDFKGNIARTLPQRNGIKVDTALLSRVIVNDIFSPPLSPITFPVQVIQKTFPSYDMNAVRKQALLYTQQPIAIISGGVTFTLTPSDLRYLLTVSEQVDSNNPKQTIMVLSLDRVGLVHLLAPYATEVEAATHAEFNEYDIYPAIYSQFYSNTRTKVAVPIGAALQEGVLGASTANAASQAKVVYLTFDDGPNIIYHPLILDILKEKNVKATFYLVGINSRDYKNITERTIAEGHAIGNHTLSHQNLTQILPNQIIDELKTTNFILNGFLGPGKKLTLFRPPYGGTDNLVVKDAALLGLKQELWTVDPKDWSEPSTADLIHRVISSVRPGAVILMHSNHFATVKALPYIIDNIKTMGYQFKIQE